MRPPNIKLEDKSLAEKMTQEDFGSTVIAIVGRSEIENYLLLNINPDSTSKVTISMLAELNIAIILVESGLKAIA